MGAALNGLAMMGLTAGWQVEESYDFGKPRIGDQKFAAAFNKLFRGRAWRVTHAMDPAPQVPPDKLIVDWHFEHVEPEIYYKGNVSEGHQECRHPHTTVCSEQYYDIPLDLFHVADHLDYMDQNTSSEGCDAVPLQIVV